MDEKQRMERDRARLSVIDTGKPEFRRGKLRMGPAEISWKLGFGNGAGEIRYLSADDMPSFEPTANGGIWSGDGGLTVTVVYEKRDGITLGKLSFSGAESQVEEVRFPCAEMDFDAKPRILTPISQGRILKDLAGEWDGPLRKYSAGRYRSFRFTAALFGGRGMYFDCRDGDFYNKSFVWSNEHGKLAYSHIHTLPLDGSSGFVLPYWCGMAEFSGDWFEAAMIYRRWALQQCWYVGALKDKNPLKGISMWLWNRGRIDHVMPPAERLAEDSGVPVALDWYWWHHNPYDTDYPDFWPPREGEEAFRTAVKRMNDRGIFTQVYTNGRTWDIDNPSCSREGGRNEIECERGGGERAKAYNTYNHHRLGFMCGEAEIFPRKLARVVKKLTDSGLPGVYLDMIGHSTGLNCYNPRHKHAPGGGTYNVTGYRRMLEMIRRENPGKVFSTEDCAENWLDLFESMIVLPATSAERLGDASDFVPAFSAVYHGANALYGSCALPDGIPAWDELWPAEDRFPAGDEQDWNALCPCQSYIELARDIVWGMQPMICNFQMKHIEDPKFADIYRFILDTARFHHANCELLYSAEMAPPGTLECAAVDVDFMARGIFTKKEDLRFIRRRGLPAILHSVWYAPTGGRALILANYTPERQCYKFEDVSGEMPPRSYRRVDLEP